MLDRVAQRYGCRPSALLAIGDPETALTIDVRAAAAGAEADACDRRKAEAAAKRGR